MSGLTGVRVSAAGGTRAPQVRVGRDVVGVCVRVVDLLPSGPRGASGGSGSREGSAAADTAHEGRLRAGQQGLRAAHEEDDGNQACGMYTTVTLTTYSSEHLKFK